MQESESGQLEKVLQLQAGRVGFEAVVPNPKPKLLEQVREVMRLRHYRPADRRLIQESLVAADDGLGDDFKEAPGGDFHKARIVRFGGSRAALG